MGSVYDRTEKEYYHNKRHRCTCRDTGILLPNCGQGQLLPDAVFLSAQLYLYRSVRRLGALRPSADRAKAGVQVYDGHRSTAHHMDGSPFGKVFYILAAGCVRYLWYLFYLPMLFVPMLALLIAMSLGKPDEYKFPKGMSILWIISGTLLLLVLTNDLHQFVFTFPKDAAVWTDKNNGYSIGYFIIVGWQVLCAFAALVIMFFKCRVQKGRLHFLPIVPMLLTIVYSVLYYAGADWLLHLFGDIAAFQSVMYILTFELCIACGYIHSNSRYVDLFASSVGTSAEITDKDFTVRYAAVNTAPISKETMKKAEQSPVTMGGLTVHTMPIDGGYAVWTEDVSALRDIKEDSELLADELADRNEILRYEYKREAKRRKVEEQNRLYDLLRSATQTQIDRIAELTKEYRRISSTDPDSAKTLLAEIAVLCSYIKRRKHLTLLTDRDIKIAETELHRAFNESLQTLKLLGVRSSLYVDESLSMLSGKTATAVFDFYESVIEADILNLTGIQVSLIKANGLRLSLNVCCKADLSALVNGDSIRCEKEDDEEYQHLVFEAKEGDRK